ncbi:MAG: prephenate dehydrogenase/arogenate dehydrogenase family protein [Acidobacteria bacterium]|nr:prephenate dehydrogenase/arogenate dehydrogenase family protein [Acidobacteriota bacterium]
MKINIIGDGSFGTFLKELLPPVFEIDAEAETVILAVPISAYDSLAAEHSNKHLINVCSVQKPSTDFLLKHTPNVTAIHPLFGKRTPDDRRNTIVTRELGLIEKDSKFAEDEREFLTGFSMISAMTRTDHKGEFFTPDSHDKLMAKTHVAAVLAAKQMKVFVERAEDIPDEFLPNSFRLMRDFVRTLDDMPQGTIESIMANPYF